MNSVNSILIVDDDSDMCLLLSRFLSRNGYEVASVSNGKSAIDWLRKNTIDLVLCDFRLDDMTGADLLPRIKVLQPECLVIIITGYSDVKDAVEVIKSGAIDYITKPLFPDEILITIKKALSPLKSKKGDDTTGRSQEAGFNGSRVHFIVGETPEFSNIIRQIDLVAPTNYSVIIYGESGSGKEVIAHQIHMKSKRATKPFVAIDCGALSKDLAGSELFGHEKGSFTGASSQKNGSLEVANSGTVFLDEIGNLPYDVQVSLLRVVQERKIRRIGSTKDIELDVRIIVASNEKLWDAARSGRFREDLYHRFNEFSIEVPSLRDRKSDIMLFAHHFLSLTNEELGKNVKGFTPEVEAILMNYVWYGNLRELKNVIKRATLLSDGEWIEAKTLPFEISNFAKLQFESGGNIGRNENRFTITEQGSLEKRMRTANISAEYGVIMDALKQSNFNKSKAAKLLNIDRKTLYNKMRDFNDNITD